MRGIIEDACLAAMWSREPAFVGRRFERALTSQQLSVRTRAVRLEAWLTRDADLAVRVDVLSEWDAEQESRLRELVECSDSPLAEILVDHWHLVRSAFTAKSRSDGR